MDGSREERLHRAEEYLLPYGLEIVDQCGGNNNYFAVIAKSPENGALAFVKHERTSGALVNTRRVSSAAHLASEIWPFGPKIITYQRGTGFVDAEDATDYCSGLGESVICLELVRGEILGGLESSIRRAEALAIFCRQMHERLAHSAAIWPREFHQPPESIYAERRTSDDALNARLDDLLKRLAQFNADHEADLQMIHGDFYADNIFAAEDGFKVIDAKGHFGHPAEDLAFYASVSPDPIGYFNAMLDAYSFSAQMISESRFLLELPLLRWIALFPRTSDKTGRLWFEYETEIREAHALLSSNF